MTVGDGGDKISVPFISPADFVQFLLAKAPELVLGGFTKLESGQENLKSFWSCYQKVHPGHGMFSQDGHVARWPTTLALSLHGDEGRGLKKGNTCVIMLESNLGLQTCHGQTKRKVNVAGCADCCVSDSFAKRCRTSTGFAPKHSSVPTSTSAASQVTNLKNHSFLTKFVLCALPRAVCKRQDAMDAIAERFCEELRRLATDGVLVRGQRWFAQLTGLKGDLDWFKKLGGLTRCYKQQLGQGEPCCHECGAGAPDLPFEDADHQPCWANSMWFARPWQKSPALVKLVFSEQHPESALRRDVFHNTKVGIFRDFLGASILLLCKFSYFNFDGQSNRRELQLERAFGHFRLWCASVGKTPGLHSFTPLFFNAPNQNTFGWVNSKGSDSMMLLSWIQVALAAFQRDLIDPSHAETLRIMQRCAQHADAFTNMTYDHGLWLSRHCAAKLYSDMHLFLTAYNTLAFWSLHKWQFTAYGMKAKYHMLCHTKFDILTWLADPTINMIPNPQIWGCEMNEDVVGKVSRLSRRCSTRNTGQQALQLYLTKCKAVHRRFLKGLRQG